MGSSGMDRVKRQAVWAVALCFGIACSVHAQPGARAARLSDVDGQVQLALSANNQITADSAPLNTPIFEGTRIGTAEDGRAEVQFDDGSVMRMAPNSEVLVNVLRQEGGVSRTELELVMGLVYFELQGESTAASTVLHFGQNTVTASGFTVLRIDMDDPPGTLAVFSGNAHLANPLALALELHGGESARLQADSNTYALAESVEANSWDAWNADRDQQLTNDEALRTQATVNVADAQNPAWSALDANGSWYNVPGVGFVWSPYAATAAGWDPYGCGYWVWTAQYGYVWASCYPWGFLPYAGGGWGYYDGIGWGWYPGGGGWWWSGGGWTSTVPKSSFQYTNPHRPHGGPIFPGHGNPTSVKPGKPVEVVEVNRFKGGEVPTGEPRSGTVKVGTVTLRPLRPLGEPAMRNHEPAAVGGTYVVSGSQPRSGAVTAPGGRGTTYTSEPGARQGYAPVTPGRPAMPGGGSGQPPRAGGQSGSTGYAPRATSGGGGGSRPSGGSAPSSGAVHSGGGGGGGGGAASAPHSSPAPSSSSSSPHK